MSDRFSSVESAVIQIRMVPAQTIHGRFSRYPERRPTLTPDLELLG